MWCDVPRYLEWAPRRELRRHVSCTWVGPVAGADPEPVLPDGCMDIIWDGERLFVAGPDTRAVSDDAISRPTVGIRFRPGIGSLFLGPPAFELRDCRLDLSSLWADASSIADRLSATGHVSDARALLEEAVAARLANDPSPDTVVEGAVRAWRMDWRTATPSLLAERAGISERQLHRRFLAAVGYGPTYLRRVLRFQSFLQLSGEPRLGLGELAYRCGYADQAHLNRETAALAGRTPAQLRAVRMRDVRFVQDGL